MNMTDVGLFLDAARLGSFAAAARSRGLDPSSASRSVAALEAELGVRLFQRTTRRFSLTEAGALWRARVEPLVEEFARAAAEASQASGAPQGQLRLTASVALGVSRITPLLPAFRDAFPALKVECLFTDANLDLVAERIDLALRLAPAIEGDLIATKLFDTRYHVVASPRYLETAPPLRAPDDLAGHRCLLLALPAFRARWLFRDAKGRIEEVAVDGDVVISSPLALRASALTGLGPALLSDVIIGEDLRAGRLVDLFPKRRATATTFETGAWAVYPSRAFLPGKVRAAIDFFRSALAPKRN